MIYILIFDIYSILYKIHYIEFTFYRIHNIQDTNYTGYTVTGINKILVTLKIQHTG